MTSVKIKAFPLPFPCSFCNITMAQIDKDRGIRENEQDGDGGGGGDAMIEKKTKKIQTSIHGNFPKQFLFSINRR